MGLGWLRFLILSASNQSEAALAAAAVWVLANSCGR
jgi:hypothetical protein